MSVKLVKKAKNREPLIHERLTYSAWQDFREGNPDVIDYINSSEHRQKFLETLQKVLDKMNRFERAQVMVWTGKSIYIEVEDTRWNHYPCNMRLLMAFDLETGEIGKNPYTTDGVNFMAKKGWRAFADKLAGFMVDRYSDCGCQKKAPRFVGARVDSC